MCNKLTMFITAVSVLVLIKIQLMTKMKSKKVLKKESGVASFIDVGKNCTLKSKCFFLALT